ncbi:hypothetical protein ACQPXS_02655 [Streptomyces sp. CA-142005]|uniref:hypothetical protein n=1 Tax=Streptomyces sp. CA-142005 TaxID=3240052 RepID=UPI003D8D6590
MCTTVLAPLDGKARGGWPTGMDIGSEPGQGLLGHLDTCGRQAAAPHREWAPRERA